MTGGKMTAAANTLPATFQRSMGVPAETSPASGVIRRSSGSAAKETASVIVRDSRARNSIQNLVSLRIFSFSPAPVRKPKEKAPDEPVYTRVQIICRPASLESLKTAMNKIGITGMTVTNVMGYGAQKGKPEYYRGTPVETTLLPKVQVDIVVSKVPVREVIDTARSVLHTGHIGDGKIFVTDVENVVRVRTGEEGYDALQSDE